MLRSIIDNYLPAYKAKYGSSISAEQHSAINAIRGCQAGQYGDIHIGCSQCNHQEIRHQSCGHRHCNQCQNHATTQWLDRQKAKLLPVNYFMVTFTLPYEYRALAKANQRIVYNLLFQCAVQTLKDFGKNDKTFAAELAMTAVLHTHARNLDYHPHVHLIVPGGGINKERREWRRIKGEYLFNAFNLAAVFKGKFLKALNDTDIKLPDSYPKKWVAHCEHVGHGLPALKYLSRYLYRGVIANDNIIDDDGEYVTFQYKESKTKKMTTRRLKGEDFIALIMQHILPKGFRRSRDYGFLHGNGKRWLILIQWVLKVFIAPFNITPRPTFTCRKCESPMTIIGFNKPAAEPG